MHGKSRLIYFIEYSWLFTLLLFASAIYLNQGNIGLFFNSDILTSVLLLKDLFFQHGHYTDWMIPAAHHFFPDLFIASFVHYFVKNIYLFFLIMIWISIISMYIAVKLIYCQFFSVKKGIFFALMTTSSLFLLAFSSYPVYCLAQVPFIHVGEFIAGIFLLGIQIKLIYKDKLTYKNYILLAISAFIAFSCSASDLLFFVQFVSPIFISYSFFFLIRKIKFPRYLLLASLVILPAILGIFTVYLMPNYSLAAYLDYPSLTKVSFSTIIMQCLAFIHFIKSNAGYFIQTILGIFYLNLFFITVSKLFIKDKKNIKNDIDKKLFLNLFILLSIFFSIGSIFSLTNVALVISRYMLPLFFFPLLLFFIPIAYLNNKLLTSRIFSYLAGLFFICIMLSLFIFINKPGFKLHTSYYPEYVHCIDKSLRGYGHNGIAQYWEANLITALSKEDVEAVPVVNLIPFIWSINVKKFKKPINFAMLDMFDSVNKSVSIENNLIYRRYGIPDKIVLCDKIKILIYSKTFSLN